MWAEISLDILNDEAVQEYDRRVAEGKIPYNNSDAVFPVSLLISKMKTGPQLISSIISLLQGDDYVNEFKSLVEEIMPDRLQEVMNERGDRKVLKFIQIFNTRFFILDTKAIMADEPYQLISSIPVAAEGMTYDSYANFTDFRPGYILMLSLIMAPYYFDDDDEVKIQNPDRIISDKIPIMDMVGSMVKDWDLLRKIPEKGWDNIEIRNAVKDTANWWGLADFADWVMHDTQWDIENYSNDEAIITIPWSLDTVKTLTIQFPEIHAAWKRINSVADWLERDVSGHYRELVEFLLKATKKKGKRGTKLIV
ncbi:MAG: hypothetical protein WC364_10285 [Eubacteriales bacterium]|jgi:hypothetical protein